MKPPLSRCVLLQNLKTGMLHWSCYAFWAFRRNMDLLLQVTYSLASRPVMSDAASDCTGVSAQISALLLLPVCVPLAALISGCQECNHHLQHASPRPGVGAPGARGVVAGMAHSLPRARGLQVHPRHHMASSTAEGSGHRYCLSRSWRGESPTVILISPF